jgi:hypothetical protein
MCAMRSDVCALYTFAKDIDGLYLLAHKEEIKSEITNDQIPMTNENPNIKYQESRK